MSTGWHVPVETQSQELEQFIGGIKFGAGITTMKFYPAGYMNSKEIPPFNNLSIVVLLVQSTKMPFFVNLSMLMIHAFLAAVLMGLTYNRFVV